MQERSSVREVRLCGTRAYARGGDTSEMGKWTINSACRKSASARLTMMLSLEFINSFLSHITQAFILINAIQIKLCIRSRIVIINRDEQTNAPSHRGEWEFLLEFSFHKAFCPRYEIKEPSSNRWTLKEHLWISWRLNTMVKSSSFKYCKLVHANLRRRAPVGAHFLFGRGP